MHTKVKEHLAVEPTHAPMSPKSPPDGGGSTTSGGGNGRNVPGAQCWEVGKTPRFA